MTLLALAVLVGIILAAGPGKLGARAIYAWMEYPWRWPALPMVLAAAQVANGTTRLAARSAITIVTSAGVVVWLLVQRTGASPRSPARRSVTWVAAGAVANLIPTAVYGAMPVSAAALAHIGVRSSRDVTVGQLGKHVLTRGYRAVDWLGDVLPVPVKPFRSAISIGDIGMAIGIVLFFLAARSPSGRRETVVPVPAESSDSREMSLRWAKSHR
jgi:hypothetical protein